MRAEELPFELEDRTGGHPWIVAIAVAGAVGLLALLMLIAVYALNVGTIWSKSSAKPAHFSIGNQTRSTLAVLLKDQSGVSRQLTRLAPGGKVRIPVRGRCFNGLLVAVDGRGREVELRPAGCAGEAWTITG